MNRGVTVKENRIKKKMIVIHSCFSIGYKCTTDDFMKLLGIRRYSSPFSYMVCDLESSLHFIDNHFENFLKVKYIKKEEHTFMWNTRLWDHDLFFNEKYIPQHHDVRINECNKMCCWNHHDLFDTETVKSIERRIHHLLLSLNGTKNCLLLCIDNIRKRQNDLKFKEYYEQLLRSTTCLKKDNVFLCILVPILEYKSEPTKIVLNSQCVIILYNSSLDLNTNDIRDTKIEWDKLKEILTDTYTFEIESREMIE